MILILIFAAGFAYGWVKAKRAGGRAVDRLRYGIIHGLAPMLAVYAIASLGDWQGFF